MPALPWISRGLAKSLSMKKIDGVAAIPAVGRLANVLG
jgi:hypothetical protein